MIMNKRLSLVFVLMFVSAMAFAQTNAGDAFFVDYAQFQQDNTTRYIKCPYDAVLNVGDSLTLEAWIKVHDSGWNQKVVGRTNLSFNSGYLLAIDQGKVYPEVWTPTTQTSLTGFIPPVPIPGYWYHIALTFAAGDSLKSFVNGKQVGAIAVPATGIVDNTEPLTIGISPWGESFQYFGHIDEVRIWNKALTEQELQDQLHIELAGNEAGLVAYYTFNSDTHTSINDGTSNGVNGSITNGDATNIASSTCLVAGSNMNVMQDINALWNGIGYADPRFVTTITGLSMKASGIQGDNHCIFGNDAADGTTTADIPSNAPANFERASRVFYVEQNGGMNADLLFNLEHIAGTGTELTDGKPADHYTLLYRSGTTGDFTAKSSANTKNNKTLTFLSDNLANGYYTIGVGDANFVGPSAIDDTELSKRVSIYPNPSTGTVNVDMEGIAEEVNIKVYNQMGVLCYETVTSEMNNVIDLSEQGKGIYFITLTTENATSSQKLIVQ